MAAPFPPQEYRIETPRLLIRTSISKDAEALISLMGTVENLPMGESEPLKGLTTESMVERIGRWKASALQGKNAFLSIALRDTDHVVGYMGFNCFRAREEFDGVVPERDLPLPGIEGRYLTDVGVAIDYRHRRQGYSTEVVCAALEYAFGNLGCEVVRLETGLGNEPWRALMRFIGLGHLEKQAGVSYADDGHDGFLYVVDRKEWQEAKDDLISKGHWPL